MSSILSALAESNRQIAYAVNINGTYNILEAAVSHNVGQVIIPSSIAAFGPDTPQENTPNETIQRPNTLYGISKVFGEHLGNYYHEKLGLDVRGLRLPGIISWKTEPTAGTTDYAVAIFYGAIREKKFTCYLGPHTRLPMMYMPDCIKSIIDLAQADGSGLKHHADFNVGAVSFTPSEIAEAVAARVEGFEMDYKIDPMRQAIADSWPDSLDDTAAREEWGWTPSYDLDSMSDDMLKNLKIKLSDGG
jgi:nucleoside-diphosphate-sugar epimerase